MILPALSDIFTMFAVYQDISQIDSITSLASLQKLLWIAGYSVVKPNKRSTHVCAEGTSLYPWSRIHLPQKEGEISSCLSTNVQIVDNLQGAFQGWRLLRGRRLGLEGIWELPGWWHNRSQETQTWLVRRASWGAWLSVAREINTMSCLNC